MAALFRVNAYIERVHKTKVLQNVLQSGPNQAYVFSGFLKPCDDPSRGPCNHWAKGKCTYGTNCKFYHDRSIKQGNVGTERIVNMVSISWFQQISTGNSAGLRKAVSLRAAEREAREEAKANNKTNLNSKPSNCFVKTLPRPEFATRKVARDLTSTLRPSRS